MVLGFAFCVRNTTDRLIRFLALKGESSNGWSITKAVFCLTAVDEGK